MEPHLYIYLAFFLLLLGLTGVIFLLLRRNKRLIHSYETQLQSAQTQTDAAAKAKDAFLANVSHEIRTPMNAIIGLSHILLQSNVEYDQKVTLFKIKRSAEHLLNVTNDVLDYSKLEAGKLDIEMTDVDTDALLSNIADIVAPAAVEKKLDLIFVSAPGVPESWEGDPLRVSQILINLINNAIKFTREGHVRLDVTYDETGVHFKVADTGIGISAEQQQRLFKAFSQADGSISRKYGGTGLGLVISNELATMMGSSITLQSNLKHGSSFAFTLPVTPNESKPQSSLPFRLMENKSFLLFDQCAQNSAVLAEILKHYGAIPTVADSEAAFGTLLMLQRYDAACIDSRLLASLAQQYDIKAQCDTLIVLQYDMMYSNENARLADAILNKPFTPMQLQGVITECFGQQIRQATVVNKHVTFDDIAVLGGARILLAEDNEGNAMVVEGLLEGSGIDLVITPDGQKAVETLMHAKLPFDLILMDINMPVMDGFTATSIIREYQKYDGVPIIMMTANITESDMEKARSRGMQDSVSKPVEVEHFYRTLLKYIAPKQPAKTVAGVSPTSKATAAFTGALPGVDTKNGLARVNGNATLYRNILSKYLELFHDVTGHLKRQAQNSQWDEGRKLAHNLKGLSGNIGAEKVFEDALAVETAFKERGKDLARHLNQLHQDLAPLLKTLSEQRRARTPAKKRARVTRTQSLNALNRLKEACLKHKALEAKKIVSKLKAVELPAPLDVQSKTIFAAVEQYRFEAAVSELESVLKEKK